MTKTLTEQELTEKGPDVMKILSASFEYLLAGIASEHAKMLDTDNISQFNRANRLSWPLLLCYPFFVSLANGNSKSLYSLFGPFVATKHGPLSMSIYDMLDAELTEEFPRYFKHFTNPKSPEIYTLKAKDENGSFHSIKESIREELIQFQDGTNIRFADVKVVSDEKINLTVVENSLIKAINSSLKVIEEQSGNTFFDGDPRTIIQQSAFYEGLTTVVDNDSARWLSYEDVGQSKYRAFYDDIMHL